MGAKWKLEPMAQYQVNLSGKWSTGSGFLMGLFFFLRIVYYLAVGDITGVGTGILWTQLILPCVCAGVFFVLLRGVRLDVPLLYGIIFSLMCILRMIWGFDHAGIFWMIWYILMIPAALATTYGLIPSRVPMGILFGVPALTGAIRLAEKLIPPLVGMVGQLADRKLPHLGLPIGQMLPEISIAALAASMFCLTVSMEKRK